MSMKQDAARFIKQAIDAVLPDTAVQRALQSRSFSRPVTVIAIGKAAWRMAHAAQGVLQSRMKEGLVITKYGHSEGPIPGIRILEAGHPVPDENGLLAAEQALHMADALTAEDEVLFLLSGGGSALFEAPLPGVTLSDLSDLTRQLLACGADIVEINTLRKHLSAVKGGRFAARCAPAHITALVLSDVLGDTLDAIASGPACPDSSTSADAEALAARYHLHLSDALLAALRQETPKALDNAEHVIIGSVQTLCRAAMEAAAQLGYKPLLLTTTLNSEARDAGERLAALAREIRSGRGPIQPPCAVLLGGETVVHVHGNGKGGRNQELALAAAPGIDGLRGTLIFSVGSDGTDGPTDAAGGLVTGEFAAHCRRLGLSIDAALADNDAYPLLKQAGGLIVTGPTGTNVNDLTVLLMQ